MCFSPRPTRSSSSLTIAALALVAVAGCGDAGTAPELDRLEVDGPAFSHLDGPAAWTAAGPGTVTLVSDGTAGDASMTYRLTGPAVFSTRTWELSTTAHDDGTITIPWSYSGFHAFFNVRAFARAFVSNADGTTNTALFMAGPVNCCTPPSGGFTRSGSVVLSVKAGDVYGFRFGGSNFDTNSILRGTFTADLPTKEECKEGGWASYGFANQGLCVAYTNTGHDSR